MTGEEGGGGGGSGVSVSAMCLVCGTNQANLTQHLSLHTKDEIIRAVTHGRPLPELARKPGPPRPRKINIAPAPMATMAPLSLRPATGQPQLLVTGSQPQQPPVTTTMTPTPQFAPPPQPAPSQPVRLSSIAPLIQPSRNGVPIPPNPVQSSTPAPAGNYLLIGNNMFPASSVISNNLQLGNSGVSYIIPSSGGLVLAATAPSSSQTLLVQPSNTAPPLPLPVKQSTPALPSLTTLPGGAYNGVTCRPPRPVQSSGPQCMFDGPAALVQNEVHTPATDTPWQKPAGGTSEPSKGGDCSRRNDLELESHRATINIGKNISISLPRELVGQKEKLKEIINQELVRALLMNEAKKGRGAEGLPSTSGITRKTIYYPSKTEDDDAVSVDQEFCQEDSNTIELDEDVQCCEDTRDEDPLASDPLSGSPHPRGSTSVSFGGSSISSPANSIAIDNTLNGGFITSDPVGSYPSDGPMQVFNERNQSSGRSSPSLIVGHTGEDCDKGIVREQLLMTNGTDLVQDAYHRRPDKLSETGEDATMADSISATQGEFGQMTAPPIISSNISQPVKRDHMEEGGQPMSFLATERNLSGLLGTSSLQEMDYVEEQVLGAVEEVFSGDASISTTPMPCTISEAGNQKLVQQRLGHPYSTVIGEQLSQLPSASYRDNTQDKEPQDVKCKYEVSGVSGKSRSSVGTMAATTYESQHKDSTQSSKEEVKCKFEVGGPSGHMSMSHVAAGTSSSYGSHGLHQHNTFEFGSSSSTTDKLEKLREEKMDEEEEELVDDPSLVVDSLTGGAIFPDDPMFDREMSGQHGEEVMSLKASETLADSDSERATPHEELSDLMFYDRSCMFAGEPGPANLSPRAYPSMDTSGYHSLAPAVISP